HVMNTPVPKGQTTPDSPPLKRGSLSRILEGALPSSARSGETLAVIFVGEEPLVATVVDLSASCIDLSLDRALSVGTEVVAKLFAPSRSFCCTRLLRVDHITQRSEGDFLNGLRFEKPLTPEQLRILLESRNTPS